jgi:hypothetical protein
MCFSKTGNPGESGWEGRNSNRQIKSPTVFECLEQKVPLKKKRPALNISLVFPLGNLGDFEAQWGSIQEQSSKTRTESICSISGLRSQRPSRSSTKSKAQRTE